MSVLYSDIEIYNDARGGILLDDILTRIRNRNILASHLILLLSCCMDSTISTFFLVFVEPGINWRLVNPPIGINISNMHDNLTFEVGENILNILRMGGYEKSDDFTRMQIMYYKNKENRKDDGMWECWRV